MNQTTIGNTTYFQCGGVDNFLSNDTTYYNIRAAYICGYQQAKWKSAGERVTLLSSLYLILGVMTMLGFVFADIQWEKGKFTDALCCTEKSNVRFVRNRKTIAHWIINEIESSLTRIKVLDLYIIFFYNKEIEGGTGCSLGGTGFS